MVKVDEGVGGPEPVPHFLSCNDLTRPLQKQRKNLEGLLLQLDPHPIPTQFTGAEIDFEGAKPASLRCTITIPPLHEGKIQYSRGSASNVTPLCKCLTLAALACHLRFTQQLSTMH